MSAKPERVTRRREPVRTRWIWAVFAVLFVMLNPWYFGSGATRLVGGVPLWALIILGVSLALSVFLHYVCVVHWQTEEDGDE